MSLSTAVLKYPHDEGRDISNERGGVACLYLPLRRQLRSEAICTNKGIIRYGDADRPSAADGTRRVDHDEG